MNLFHIMFYPLNFNLMRIYCNKDTNKIQSKSYVAYKFKFIEKFINHMMKIEVLMSQTA